MIAVAFVLPVTFAVVFSVVNNSELGSLHSAVADDPLNDVPVSLTPAPGQPDVGETDARCQADAAWALPKNTSSTSVPAKSAGRPCTTLNDLMTTSSTLPPGGPCATHVQKVKHSQPFDAMRSTRPSALIANRTRARVGCGVPAVVTQSLGSDDLIDEAGLYVVDESCDSELGWEEWVGF
jgi:hypothetical protein